MPEIGTSGSMSGDGKRSAGLRAPSYRAHPRLYLLPRVARLPATSVAGISITVAWQVFVLARPHLVFEYTP